MVDQISLNEAKAKTNVLNGSRQLCEIDFKRTKQQYDPAM
jgi:hypothetical protein